ncbi:hypothetical protein BYT27DRAFT_7193808 [Phlegmacium glaucopus]|nr:hypothetical protein BYT27DRAFT_7193808 [Phlegmacium glaucopus]
MQAPHAFPALLGDGKGRYRVHVLGNSGSGKSTTGAALAAILGVPFISLDTVMWKPGWGQTPRDEFQAKLRSFMEEHQERGWVAEGDYVNRGGSIMHDEATDIIWLDPPLLLYFPRLVIRTFLRLFRLRPPCAPGCEERIGEIFFSKESIIWWCISSHWSDRERNRVRMQQIGLGIGSDIERRRMRRIGGWGSTLKRWLSDVQKMVDLRKAKLD